MASISASPPPGAITHKEARTGGLTAYLSMWICHKDDTFTRLTKGKECVSCRDREAPKLAARMETDKAAAAVKAVEARRRAGLKAAATRRRNLAKALKDAEKAAAKEARDEARAFAKKAAAKTVRTARTSAPPPVMMTVEALQPGKAATRAPWEDDEDDIEDGASLEAMEDAHEAPPW